MDAAAAALCQTGNMNDDLDLSPRGQTLFSKECREILLRKTATQTSEWKFPYHNNFRAILTQHDE